ncbi:MAG: phosphoribosylglycinamide formyltransferase [Bacteroidetes bacterium]|nr:MAG: phosphoribosylglycinamide formyltransferase [Bacteroidota bacterium]
MKKIALFASGNGTNVQRIAEYFKDRPDVTVSMVLTNNPKAGVLMRAEKLGLKTLIFSRDEFYHSSKIVNLLKELHVDLIVLAGFLWLLPEQLITAFPDKIINLHPALLPKYGGKGMYGHHVHEAVIKNKETKSGITIHYVNVRYDEGQIIFQSSFGLTNDETPESLAKKIHLQEHEHFPKVIERLLAKPDE